MEQIIFDSSYLLRPATLLEDVKDSLFNHSNISHPSLKQCVYFRYIKNCNHSLFEINVSFLLVVPLLSLAVNYCHLLSLVVICCHLLYHLLSLAVIHCHLLSLVVPVVAICYHLLSLVVIRCHSLYHSLSFVVTRCTTRCHSLSLVVTQCTSRLSFYKRCVNNRPCLCIPYLSLLFLSTCRSG